MSLTVTVHVDTPDPVLVPPTVTPIACPLGTQGVGARVFSGSASAIVSGFVTVVLDDGVPVTVQIDEVVLVGGQTLTVFACAGLTPGASLPSLPVGALL